MSKDNPNPAVENDLVRQALEAIAQIDAEAQKKKAAHLDELRTAQAAIQQRVAELRHQEQQLDAAIAKVIGRSAQAARRPQRDRSELRDRVLQWLSAHAGTAYSSAQLTQEFPELRDTAGVPAFLKAAIEGRQIIVDASQGRRHQTYAAK